MCCGGGSGRHDTRASPRSPHRLAHPCAPRCARLRHGTSSAAAARSAGSHGAGAMSVGFRAVQWNRAKLIYDAVLLGGVAVFIAGFMTVGAWLHPPKNFPEVLGLCIDAFGSCAFAMLTVILSIGPLARLDHRFLPLLYNRRHFGVLTFMIAALHLCFMLEWYLAQDVLPTLLPELLKGEDYGKFIGFPFKILGIAALLILFLMAATSHDYWLVFLTP